MVEEHPCHKKQEKRNKETIRNSFFMVFAFFLKSPGADMVVGISPGVKPDCVCVDRKGVEPS
jgi:hypothetical protein